MNIYCLEDFKLAFERLKSKKSYRSIESDLIEYFFDKDVNQLLSGTRLNQDNNAPYIKKRINGSGGFRFYFLLLVKNENLYLMFVHPKTGSLGGSNITDESKTALYKKVYQAIESDNLFELKVEDEKLIRSKS